MAQSSCLFCRIVRGEIPSKKAYEDDQVFAFHDINPQAPTHILIVPKEHLATVNDFKAAHKDLIGEMVMAAARIAAQEGIAERGYRLVFNCNAEAGQVVFHVHLHLLGGWGSRASMDM